MGRLGLPNPMEIIGGSGSGDSNSFQDAGGGSRAGGILNKAQSNESLSQSYTFGASDGSIVVGPGGTLSMADYGALDLAGRVQRQAMDALAAGTTEILKKQTMDSGERLQTVMVVTMLAAAALAGVYFWRH